MEEEEDRREGTSTDGKVDEKAPSPSERPFTMLATDRTEVGVERTCCR